MHPETVTTAAIGLDIRRDTFYLAEVTRREDGFEVSRLHQAKVAEAAAEFMLPGVQLAVAVPDASVMVKNLLIPASSPGAVESVVSFELAESLLEDLSEFRFQTVPTGQPGRYLGLIYRRESLRELTARLGVPETEAAQVTHLLRALALGRGYLAFCERAAGELIGLVDLGGDTASVCLLLQNGVVDLASVDLRGFDLTHDTGRKQFAIDLKTVVNFRRAALQDRGVGLPLSTIILSGDNVDGRLREMVRGYFPGGVEAPRFRLGLFRPECGLAETNPEHYLVALGLAAN